MKIEIVSTNRRVESIKIEAPKPSLTFINTLPLMILINNYIINNNIWL
jgi:hypothetical protein